jgi:CheY-like chemotaxis protein
MCRSNAVEKRIELRCDLDPRVHDVVGDPGRLQQVFWNLLNNAVKFTPEGGHVYVTTENIDDEHVRLTVRDTGIGIAPDVLPRVFDAFEQGDVRITRQFGGMGLGLAISKVLVEQHRGSIRAETGGTNEGSTFVVEDHPDTASVLRRLLSASGHAVKTASTAADALALASEQTFDLVISDLGLPDMTGYDLMKRIQHHYPVKGIAMSGYGMEEDIKRSEQAGFSDHIVKPLSIAQLERSIRRVVNCADSRN